MKKIPIFAHCLKFEELFTFKAMLVAMRERERKREREREREPCGLTKIFDSY